MSSTFSILLPTRDRLELLRQAIESVRRQTFEDWELIVADNASADAASDLVQGLNDPRIRCIATPQLVPVTANWNRALESSTGSWAIMLGDDDGLLPGSLARFAELIERHQPDAIYANAWLLTYPGVIPEDPAGSLRPYGRAALFEGKDEPYFILSAAARELVRRSACFEMAFTFNMQHSVVSRPLIERLTIDGAFFHSPYPDFYATNAMFWAAERLLVVPERLVVIGLAPKSFGAYYFNRRDSAGVAFLANDPSSADVGDLASTILPGSPDRTAWLLAMDVLRRNVTGPSLRIDRARYRRLVLLGAFGGGRAAIADRAERQKLRARLNLVERFLVVPAIRLSAAILEIIPRPLRAAIRRALHRRFVRSPILQTTQGLRVGDLTDVLDMAGDLPKA